MLSFLPVPPVVMQVFICIPYFWSALNTENNKCIVAFMGLHETHHFLPVSWEMVSHHGVTVWVSLSQMLLISHICSAITQTLHCLVTQQLHISNWHQCRSSNCTIATFYNRSIVYQSKYVYTAWSHACSILYTIVCRYPAAWKGQANIGIYYTVQLNIQGESWMRHAMADSSGRVIDYIPSQNKPINP